MFFKPFINLIKSVNKTKKLKSIKTLSLYKLFKSPTNDIYLKYAGINCRQWIRTTKCGGWAHYVTITSIRMWPIIKKSSPRGIRIPALMVKTSCPIHWTIGPIYGFPCNKHFIKSTAQCKYRTYFFRLQNGCITFMLTGL